MVSRTFVLGGSVTSASRSYMHVGKHHFGGVPYNGRLRWITWLNGMAFEFVDMGNKTPTWSGMDSLQIITSRRGYTRLVKLNNLLQNIINPNPCGRHVSAAAPLRATRRAAKRARDVARRLRVEDGLQQAVHRSPWALSGEKREWEKGCSRLRGDGVPSSCFYRRWPSALMKDPWCGGRNRTD